MNKNLFTITSVIFSVALVLNSCSSANENSKKVADVTKNLDTTHLDFTVEEAPGWTALFKRTSGWFGADGIFTIPLNAGADRSAETDSTLFIFSDTMAGEIVDGKIDHSYPMVHNSVAYLKGNVPEEKNIKFYFGEENEKKQPSSLFVPTTPPSQSGDYYWMGDGFVNHALNGDTYIFAYRMRNMDKSDWSFTQVGNVIITLPAGSRPPYKDQRQVETPFLYKGGGEADNGSFGAGIFVNTKDAGAPNADGYVYVYGVKGKEKNLIVARVLPQDFEKFDEWLFWDGHNWIADMHKAAYVTNGVSNELSVSPLADGRYALVFQENGMSDIIGLRLGLSPYGPFGPMIKLWNCKESQHKNYFAYNAKAHPYLSKPGELLISYNVNAFDFNNEIRENPNLYRPRFIRLKFN